MVFPSFTPPFAVTSPVELFKVPSSEVYRKSLVPLSTMHSILYVFRRYLCAKLALAAGMLFSWHEIFPASRLDRSRNVGNSRIPPTSSGQNSTCGSSGFSCQGTKDPRWTTLEKIGVEPFHHIEHGRRAFR